MADATTFTDTHDGQSLSQFERVVDTFIEPSKTFNDIRRNRSWWLPFLILAVLGYIFCGVAVQHVGWESLTTNVLKSQPRNAERLEKASPAQAAQMLSVTKGVMEGFMVGSPAVVLIVNALFALLLWGGFAFVLGGTSYTAIGDVALMRRPGDRVRLKAAAQDIYLIDPQTGRVIHPADRDSTIDRLAV